LFLFLEKYLKIEYHFENADVNIYRVKRGVSILFISLGIKNV
jgi:hypothetical protein